MDELTQYLEGLSTRLEGVENIVITETPLVVQEFLLWHWWSSCIAASSCALFGIVSLVIFFIFFRKMIQDTKDDVAPYVFGAAISIVISVFLIISSVNNTITCAKISVAPRVYLVEKAAEMFEIGDK